MRVHRLAFRPILMPILDLRQATTPAWSWTRRLLGLILLLALLNPTPTRADESAPCSGSRIVSRHSIVDLTIQANEKIFHRRAGPVEALKAYQDLKDHVKTLARDTKVRVCIRQTTENWITYRCPDGTETPTRISLQESPEACMTMVAR